LKEQFLDLLRSPKKFLLSGHEHPDGDCVGAEVALYHLIRALGGEVDIVNPDPVARSLRFLQERTPIGNFRDLQILPSFDVFVLLDCALLSRLGDMQDAVGESCTQVAVLDHHVGSECGDGDINYVDVTAAASGVLVYDLYRAMDVDISLAAAEAIFVSVVSDTGWFRYSNTDRRTMAIAAEMIDLGVRPDELYDRLFRANDPQSVGLLAEALNTHQFRLGQRLVFASLDQEILGRMNRHGFDTDGVLEPLRSIAGIEVAALFKSHPHGVKLSLRAMGDVNVQAIAAVFGGGGHVKAAGATMRMSVQDAIAAVEREVRQSLNGK
jgi:bifunctional oligoribonuclease and PAP phosphatase NrnA